MARRFSVEAIFKTIDRVTAPVSRMQQRIGRFTRSMSRGLKSVNRVTGRLAAGMRRGFAIAGVAAAGLLVSLNGVAEKADDLAKRGRRLDMGVGELQQWQFVAEQSSISVEAFGKNMDALTKRVGEAKNGFGMFRSFLKNSDKELMRQIETAEGTGQALRLVLDAMRDIEDPARRAAFASAAFSRQGLKMQNMAELSRDELAKLFKEMEQNGLITQDLANGAEDYNDAMNRLKRTWGAFIANVLLPLAPHLTEVADKTREWLVASREGMSDKILNWVKNLVANFKEVVKWAKRIGVAVGVFIAFTTVLKILIGVLTLVNLLMAANPVTLIILGILALSAALTAAIYWWREIAAAVGNFILMVRDSFVGLPTPVKVALAAIMGPIGLLIAAAAEVSKNWEFFAEFFKSMWDGIVDTVTEKVEWILGAFRKVANAARKVGQFFGLGGDDVDEAEERAARDRERRASMVSSPQERTARSIEERRSTADLTIRDETGRAEFRQRGETPGVQFSVVPTGAFE